MNYLAAKQRAKEIEADVYRAIGRCERDEISVKTMEKILDRAEREHDQCIEVVAAHDRANRFRDGMAGDPGLTGKTATTAPGRTIGGAAPFAIAERDLKALHEAATHGASYAIKGVAPAGLRSKADDGPAFSGDGLLAAVPAQLAPGVVGQAHENRLANLLPAQATGAPSLEFIRHSKTLGSPGFVNEGEAKPEVIFGGSTQTAKVEKLAARTQYSYEALSDYGDFVDYIQGELLRQLTDAENNALLYRDSGFEGLSKVSDIITVPAASGANPVDVLEATIAKLRVGDALAVPDIAVCSPDTFSAIRRTKDDRGQYLLNPDPRADEAQSIWGIPVVVTTAVTAGEFYLVDSRKFGFYVAREPITVRTSSGGDSFRSNLFDVVAELRFSLAVTRPAAVAKVTGLPHSTTIAAPGS